MVGGVTWQLLYHAVGHSILTWRLPVLQWLDDCSHLKANDFSNIGFELSNTKCLLSSPDLFILITENILVNDWV